MALGADFDRDILFGRTGDKLVPAGASDFSLIIFGLNFRFHFVHLSFEIHFGISGKRYVV